MTDGKRQGFTLLEIMIVVALLAVLVALTFPPLINSLRVVGQESAILNMDQSANRALNAVTAELRRAILPIKINDSNDNNVNVSNAVILDDIDDFTVGVLPALSLSKFMNNDAVGFGTNGRDWLDVLQRGTDFLPFAIPVPYDYGDATTSVTTLDSSMLPQLGIFMADDSPQLAAAYNVTNVTVDGGATRSRLLWNAPVTNIGFVNSIHPALAAMHPNDYDLQPGNPAPTINLANPRFLPNPFPATATERACGLIRFAPLVDKSGTPFTIEENGRANFDLNEDGVLTDTYALGRIEVLYIPAAGPYGGVGMQRIAVSTNTVLLQTNTNSASWTPLFQLRRLTGGGYAVDINLFLCDGIAQQSNVLAFNRTTPYIVRRYNSSVELRNMTFR